jgi:hypothetical protein
VSCAEEARGRVGVLFRRSAEPVSVGIGRAVWSGNSAEAVLSRIGQLRAVWFRSSAEAVSNRIGQLLDSGGQRPTRSSRRPGRPVAQRIGPKPALPDVPGRQAERR